MLGLKLPTMTSREIDLEAVLIPKNSGLPPCLYIPIAARDEAGIAKYVGPIVKTLSSHKIKKAFLVHADAPPEPEPRLPIWQIAESIVLHRSQQVWVHVDCKDYRAAYQMAFPEETLEKGTVLDHVMNRREARLKGFHYLRIVPVLREVNSSAGSLVEKWGVDYHSTPRMREINASSKAAVQYACTDDIVKMLNMMVGGGVMDVVNEAQALMEVPKDGSGSCV